MLCYHLRHASQIITFRRCDPVLKSIILKFNQQYN
ncbi:unnamed protein product, partial [Musa acuminata subsp. malaccensis]